MKSYLNHSITKPLQQMAKSSSTKERQFTTYPTPQNQERLRKSTTNKDGSKRDNISKNKIINRALDLYYRLNPVA